MGTPTYPLLDVNDQDVFEDGAGLSRDSPNGLGSLRGLGICGEHGDGRVRAEYVRTMFGPELYDLVFCACEAEL